MTMFKTRAWWAVGVLLGLPAFIAPASGSTLLDDDAQTAHLPLRWDHALASHAPATEPALPGTVSLNALWPHLLHKAAGYAPGNRAAVAALLAAQSQERQAWINAWLPKVNAFASQNRQQQTYNGLVSRTPSASVSLSASLPLWRPAERAQVDAQAAATQQSQWQGVATSQQVALAVSNAFLDGVEALGLLQLTRAQQALLSEQLRINQKRVDGGTGTVLEVLETRSRVEQTLSSLQGLQTRLHNQSLLIRQLTGEPVAWPDAIPDGASPVPVVVPKLPEAMYRLAEVNPQSREAQAQWQAAQATLRSRQHEQWQPTVDMVGDVARDRRSANFNGNSEDQKTNSRSFGIQLNWPLFSSGLQTERTKEAAALLSQSAARWDEARAQTETELRTAYANLQAAQQTLQLELNVVKTSQAGLDAMRKAFVAGIRDNTDVLNAQAQIYTSQQNLLSAAVGCLRAQAAILALLGELSAQQVAPLSEVFVSRVQHNLQP